MKSAMQLKAIIKNMAKENHISAQLVLQNFMLERLLERISVSNYKTNFILKGGFLIAAWSDWIQELQWIWMRQSKDFR